MPNPKSEPVFQEPEFSEEQFLRYEKDRAKTTIIVFLLAIGSGLLEGFLEITGFDYLSILLFIFLFIALFKILGYLKLPLPVKNSHKFYLLMVFLLASILFWSISLNPPISVNTAPNLTLQQNSSGVWTSMSQTGGHYVLLLNASQAKFELRNQVIYNEKVTFVGITSSLTGAIINSTYSNHFIYLNIKDQSYGTSLKLTTELKSGNKYFNDTQSIKFQ
jgi:hypothetical protein